MFVASLILWISQYDIIAVKKRAIGFFFILSSSPVLISCGSRGSIRASLWGGAGGEHRRRRPSYEYENTTRIIYEGRAHTGSSYTRHRHRWTVTMINRKIVAIYCYSVRAHRRPAFNASDGLFFIFIFVPFPSPGTVLLILIVRE